MPSQGNQVGSAYRGERPLLRYQSQRIESSSDASCACIGLASLSAGAALGTLGLALTFKGVEMLPTDPLIGGVTTVGGMAITAAGTAAAAVGGFSCCLGMMCMVTKACVDGCLEGFFGR